jgi:methyl-accepting chemotaxis protein
MSHSKPRRIVLIDTRFQLKMAGAFVLLQLVLTGVFAFVLYLFMDSELKAGLASAHAAYKSLDQMLLPIVAVLAGFNFLLSTVVITSFVVILSHRIAGPLHRFRIILDDLAHRQIPAHTRIRPKDQLGEVSTSMTFAVETLTADLEALCAAAEGMKKAHEAQDRDAIDQHAADLERLLGAWKMPEKRS